MPRALAVLAALVVVAAVAPAAVARVPCGPPGARTLETQGPARAFAGVRDGDRVVVGCHRTGRRTVVLGRRDRVLSVDLAGRFAAVRTFATTRTDEQLATFDLRRGSRTGGNGRGRRARPGRYTRIALDPRSGSAAYLLRLAAAAGRPSEVSVGTTQSGGPPPSPDIEADVLGFAAATLAYRERGTYRIASLDYDELPGRPGRLLQLGDLRIDAGEHGSLSARLGRSPRVGLGFGMSECVSSSGCSGVDGLRRAGRYLAVASAGFRPYEASANVRVVDLRTGRRGRRCAAPGADGPAGVGSFVLTRAGALFCAVAYSEPYSTAPPVFQIRSADRVLDEGPGIDLGSLTRRGDQLVWLHDGVERTTPLR